MKKFFIALYASILKMKFKYDFVYSRNLYASFCIGFLLRLRVYYEIHEIESGVRGLFQKITFKSKKVTPIVISRSLQDDILKKGKTTDGKRNYEVVDGSKTSTYTFKLGKDYKKKISVDKERELQELINELRYSQSLSLNEVSKELNQKGYRTVTNKVWNKSNLSLYIKRMGIGVGK